MRLIPVLLLSGIALTAVYRTVSAGLERNLGLASASVTDYGIHLARSAAVTILRAAGSTASRAAAGLILEALLRKKFLFARRENEFVAAVTAGQGLVLVHGKYLLIVVYPRHW